MKKLFGALLIALLLFGTLTACSVGKKEPLELAKFLDEDCDVYLLVDNEVLDRFADEFEVRAKGINIILKVTPTNGDSEKSGYFVYCENASTAKKMVEDLEKFADKDDDYFDDVLRFIIERSGSMVFFGCEDVWEDAKEA